MKELLQTALDCSVEYLQGLQNRSVAPSAEAIARLAELDEPLPDRPSDPRDVLRMLNEFGSPATMGMAGPRFFGFVIGGSLPVTLAANWLAGAWDQNTAYYNITPGTSVLEQTAMRWLLELFDLPREAGAAFVTGATMANFTALATARHAVLAQAGWNVEADGLFAAPSISVIVGAEVHPTLVKALGMLGLGRNRVIRVPADSQGRMRLEAIPSISGPTIICAQAGNVNTGAFDPIGEICDLAHRSGAWVHVDGSFGLWALSVPSMRLLTAGMDQADSWATDFHKWLNVPYDSGLALVCDAGALQAAMAVTAEYLPTQSPFRNPSDFVPELSRRACGVEVWAALQSLGRSGVVEMIERNCRQARRFAQGLQAAG